MVVYWFGVIDELVKTDKEVILTSELPEAKDCVFLPKLEISNLEVTSLNQIA